MSIRFKNAAGIKTVTNSIIASGQDRASLSFRFRVNTPPLFSAGINFLLGSAFQVVLYKIDAPNNRIQCSFKWFTTTTIPTLIPFFNLNVVNHFAMTYDKDNPTSQAVYINGVKTLMPSPPSTPLKTASATLSTGFLTDTATDQYDYELEDVYIVNGYVFTQADVLSLTDGVDPTTIGTSATWRGRWTLSGAKGTAPAAGDAGLSNAIDGSWPYTPFVGTKTAGSSLTYGDAMPFVSQTVYDTPVVCSSGTSIRVGVKLATTGAALPVSAGSVTTMPTIRIDGGPPITLERPFYAGTHAGIMYFMPGGQQVPKDAQVTMSTVDSWFITSVGVAQGMTDAPIVNRSGKTLYGDLPPAVRVGYNYSIGPAYWHPDRGFKNLALSIAPPATATFRDDRTISNKLETGFFTTGGDNIFDRTGVPKMQGNWALSYDDNNPANPTDIDIYCANGQLGPIEELTAYRNNGDANGVGKARVYNITRHVWNFVLQGGCSATDTVLALDTVLHITGGVAGATNQQWIKFDDEYMNITAVNATTKKITVTRGLYGSTPASHAASAVGVASYYNYFYDLSLRIQNLTTGVPNYKNLMIVSPADWTPPATPGPITLDRSPANMKGLSQFVLDSLVNGSGVVRHMDTTMGGFDMTAEPEHMRLDTDLYPSRDVKVSPSFRVVSSRAVTPATCPYFYSPIPAQNAELFTATLGADITTAPPAGTVETVTIPDAATAPVFFPLRLQFPSGEVARVLSVNGDQVQIVRGSELTTPAPQAAGPISVRYRTPITSAAQYEANYSAYVEITTQANHGLWPGVWPYTQASTDLSVMARINVTLTADVTTTTQTVFSVSTAAADAIYLAVGLEIVLDTEQVAITAVNPAAGTITVTRKMRGTTAATHTSGTVGKARSGGVFCVTKDGTQNAWSGQIGWGTSYQLTGPNKLMAQYGLTVAQPWQHVGEQTWDPTPTVVNGLDTSTVSFTGPRQSYSYEHSARVTANAPGAYHWLNIPYCTTNDGVDAIAKAIRDTLPAGKHKVVVELANEVWNSGLPWTQIMLTGSLLSGYSDRIDFFVARSGGVRDRVKDVFDQVGRGDEVLLALAWQQGGLTYPLTRARALGVDVDVCSTAPYFRPLSTAAHIAAWNNSTDEQCVDAWLFDVEYDTANIGASLVVDGAARRAHEIATGRPLQFIHYEGGLDSCTPTPASSIANGLARNMDQMYNPNRYFAEYDYPYVLKRLGGTDGIALFNHCQPPSPWGSPVDHYALWGVFEWQGQQAGRGDGSDGKADNRKCLVTPGQPNTKQPWINQDENNVSVRGQAVLDYNAAYAQNAPTDPGGGPDDGTPPVTTEAKALKLPTRTRYKAVS